LGTKVDLRKILKARLASMTDQEHEERSLNVSENLKRLLSDLGVIQRNLVTGVFAPIQREPKWDLALDGPLEKLMAYPTYAEDRMIYKLAKQSELEVSRDFGFEIRGPKKNATITNPEIIIVPGLGFTPEGKRLGRGKGFYDRYLEHSTAVKIGIAFEIQIEKDIPTDEHDIKMDFVVTDKYIYKKKS
jgi:5-formyltetrahydrofolate cyclo-ligase